MGAASEMIAWLGRGVSRVGSGIQNMAVVGTSDGLLGLGGLLGGMGLITTGAISPRLGIQLSYVYECVSVLNKSVAAMPGILYRRLPEGGKERAIDDPLFDILRYKPNSLTNQNAFTMYEYMMTSLLLWGHSYSWLNRLSDGTIADIVPLQPWAVSIKRPRPNGPLVYTVWDATGKMKEYPEENILHVRGMTFDGVIGQSPMSVVGSAIRDGIVTRDYGSTAFSQGPNSGMALSMEGVLTDKAAARLEKDLKEMGAPENWHRPPILEGGAKWIDMPFNLEDAQLLETRKFQKNDIAGIFQVPPHMIGALERATFSNIEHQNIDYVTRVLKPYLVSIEMAIMTQIFDKAGRQSFSFEFLVDSLLRGDIKARYNAYQKGILTGFLTRNESRKLEGLNPLPGLDDPLIPLNVSTVDEDGNRTEVTMAMIPVDSNGDVLRNEDGSPKIVGLGKIWEEIQPDYEGAA